MKKYLRVSLIFTLLCLLISVSPVEASTTVILRRTNVLLTQSANQSWVSFSLAKKSRMIIDVRLAGPTDSQNLNFSNVWMQYLFISSGDNKRYEPEIKNELRYSNAYQLSIDLPAGTYSFMASNNKAEKGNIRITYAISAVRGISLPEKTSVCAGFSTKVTVTREDGSDELPSVASAVSKDDGIATVEFRNSETGAEIIVNGIETGSTSITVTDKDGESAEITVEVTAYVPDPCLARESLTLKVGESFHNSVEYNTEPVTWSSSDARVAEVSESGLITAKAFGSCRIHAKFGNQTLTCEVSVERPVPDFRCYIRAYDKKTKTFTLRIKNHIDRPMLLSADGALLYTDGSSKALCRLRFLNGDKLSVAKGKSIGLKFRILGDVKAGSLKNLEIRFNFSVDGADFVGAVRSDVTLGRIRISEEKEWRPSCDKF